MKKKFLSLAALLIISGCAHNPFETEYVEPGVASDLTDCPRVVIRNEDKSILQKAANRELFKIEVVGYDGLCYFDERTNKAKAVVAPHFKITRLDDTNVEDIHFSYYLETAQGPTAYLGKKTYFTEAHMQKGQSETYHSAKEGELSIPLENGEADIYVGLYAKKADSEFKINEKF